MIPPIPDPGEYPYAALGAAVRRLGKQPTGDWFDGWDAGYGVVTESRRDKLADELERLRAIVDKAITWRRSFGGFREGCEDLGHVATEEAEDSLIKALEIEECRRETAEAATSGGEPGKSSREPNSSAGRE